MAATMEWTQNAKDQLAKKNLTEEEYEDIRYNFISFNEGSKNTSYKDTKGKVTVGIGFNMDAEKARDAWKEAFKNIKEDISFDDVYNGIRILSNDEINVLFNYSIEDRLDEIKILYPDWDKLQYNEKLVIEDLYFNSPKLVGKDTNFHQHICNYLDTGNTEYIEEAVYEVRKRSNPETNPMEKRGIQNRRNVEAEMLKPYYDHDKTLDNHSSNVVKAFILFSVNSLKDSGDYNFSRKALAKFLGMQKSVYVEIEKFYKDMDFKDNIKFIYGLGKEFGWQDQQTANFISNFSGKMNQIRQEKYIQMNLDEDQLYSFYVQEFTNHINLLAETENIQKDNFNSFENKFAFLLEKLEARLLPVTNTFDINNKFARIFIDTSYNQEETQFAEVENNEVLVYANKHDDDWLS